MTERLMTKRSEKTKGKGKGKQPKRGRSDVSVINLSVNPFPAVRWKRKPIQQHSGGMTYESTCGHWRLFHESYKGKRRDGTKIRQFWHVLYRGPFTGPCFLYVGDPFLVTDRKYARLFTSRRRANLSVQELAAQPCWNPERR